MAKTNPMRWTLRRLRESFTVRLFFSHVFVAVLTGVLVALFTFWLIVSATSAPDVATYTVVAASYSTMWLNGSPDGEPTDLSLDPMPGWTAIVNPENEVIWSRGDTECRTGTALAECAPHMVDLDPSSQFYDRDGEQWARVISPLVTGDRVVMERGPITAEPYLVYGELVLNGYGDLLLFEIVSRVVAAIPVALVLVWLITRPQVRRLSAIMQMSRRFANGDLQARTGDHQSDDVGRLAHQFDDMADAVAQNITTLHELAQRNADLAVQAEQEAIKAERARLSRDLHDAIAQRLFSLSVSTTTLPDIITQSPERGIQQAQVVAELAEQTLLDLRALLVELRPTHLVQHGLIESLKLLFRQWQTLYQIRVEPALMLTGKRLPAAIEDAVYQITHEALSNVARHAQATLVELSLVEGQQQIVLSISDNGSGFDATVTPLGAKFGLMSMRERAQMFGGRLNVESEIGKGTTIQALLPLANGEGPTSI